MDLSVVLKSDEKKDDIGKSNDTYVMISSYGPSSVFITDLG